MDGAIDPSGRWVVALNVALESTTRNEFVVQSWFDPRDDPERHRVPKQIQDVEASIVEDA